MTTFGERYPMLRHASVLKSLPDNHFEGLLSVMQPRRVARGEVLFNQGYTGDSMAVIARGAFAVRVKGPDGTETELRTLVPGDVVGEMACVDPAPRSATVAASNDSEVLLLNRQMLIALHAKGPSVLRVLLRGIIDQVTERLRATDALLDERLTSLQEKTLEMWPGSRDPFPEAAGLLPSRHTGEVDLTGMAGLEEFGPNERETLLQVSRALRFPSGAVLCAEGDRGESCFVVVAGKVGVYRAVEGEQRKLATMQRCLLGQMALVSPAPRSATLRADGEVVALELSRDTLGQLLDQNSPFALRFLELLAVNGIRQLREATARLAREASSSPPPPLPDPTPRQQDFPRTVDQAQALPQYVDNPYPDLRQRVDQTQVRPALRTRPDDPIERAKSRRAALERTRPANEQQARKHTIAYMQASLQEWGMSLEELDQISVSRPAGIMSAAEKKARLGPR